jgi:16S rRNA (adenine1518-N6/adenine1519-N6)-dimethyltransferase
VVHRILKALELASQDHILEIGPGKGALTGPLAGAAQKLLLIEKDPMLAEQVREKFQGRQEVQVSCDDFLELPWERITETLGDNFKVVSNLPYQAATANLVRLLRHMHPGSLMVLMFQKEVADRLSAVPHTKSYGSLTVFTQIFADVRPVTEVPPAAFRPPPRVESTVLKFKFHPRPLVSLDQLPRFERLLSAGFSHRRKMLRQNLRKYFPEESASQVEGRLQAVAAAPTARAEELSTAQWIRLFRQ